MTDAPAEKTAISLDDLLSMGEDARVELIDGEIVQMPAAGVEHHIIAGNAYDILSPHVKRNNLGAVFFDGLTCLMFSPVGRLKDSFVPDVSFIRLENIPADWDIAKPHPGVPDLAVEVVSPDDKADHIEAKVRTYLDKGTRQVWLMYPRTRDVHQFTASERDTSRVNRGAQKIDAEALFPGIEGLTPDAIFALPSWAIKNR